MTSVASSIVPDPPGKIKKASPFSNNIFFLWDIVLTIIVFEISKFKFSPVVKNSGITPITFEPFFNAAFESFPINPLFPPP